MFRFVEGNFQLAPVQQIETSISSNSFLGQNVLSHPNVDMIIELHRICKENDFLNDNPAKLIYLSRGGSLYDMNNVHKVMKFEMDE